MKPKRRRHWLEGYEKVDVVVKTPRGLKTKTTLKYVGDQYQFLLDPEKWKKQKKLSLLLSVLAAVIYIFVLMQNTGSSTHKIFAPLSLLCLFPFYFVLFGAIKQLRCEQTMTVQDFRNGVLAMRIGAIVGAVALFLLFAADLVLIVAQVFVPAELVSCGCYFIAACLLLIVFAVSYRSRHYKIIKGKNMNRRDDISGEMED